MKKILIYTINIYQNIFSTLLHQLTGTKNACRFTPTCSEYAKISISENGIIKGSVMTINRILKCQPFYGVNKI